MFINPPDLSLLDSHLARRKGRQHHSAEAPVGDRRPEVAFEEKLAGETYEDFYGRGGWTYDHDIEAAFLWHRILKPLSVKHQSDVLELGCGNGVHAHLLARLGMKVTAVDKSRHAIQVAEQYGLAHFMCADAWDFVRSSPPSSYDMVFVRAMSWFHYELEAGPNRFGIDLRAFMGELVSLLRPRSLFVLQIRTDFSGTMDPTGVRNHSKGQLDNFCRAFGDVVLFTDWNGVPIDQSEAMADQHWGAIIAFRKQ